MDWAVDNSRLVHARETLLREHAGHDDLAFSRELLRDAAHTHTITLVDDARAAELAAATTALEEARAASVALPPRAVPPLQPSDAMLHETSDAETDEPPVDNPHDDLSTLFDDPIFDDSIFADLE